jgi:hypothetical protein
MLSIAFPGESSAGIVVGSSYLTYAAEKYRGFDHYYRLFHLVQRCVTYTILGGGDERPFKTGTFSTAFLVVTLSFVRLPLIVLMETNRTIKKGWKHCTRLGITR